MSFDLSLEELDIVGYGLPSYIHELWFEIEDINSEDAGALDQLEVAVTKLRAATDLLKRIEDHNKFAEVGKTQLDGFVDKVKITTYTDHTSPLLAPSTGSFALNENIYDDGHKKIVYVYDDGYKNIV